MLALLGYSAFYACDAQLRNRRGPWAVTFEQGPDGTPAVRIEQSGLGLSNIVVRFVGESIPASTKPLPQRVVFQEPNLPVPFGKTVFDDLMYLPGTVVLHCFGHEVQMLPRALFLDRRSREWASNLRHDLTSTDKPLHLERTGPQPSPAPRGK